MILHIHGDLNPYYAQTLCLIYFPGSKFGEDEVEADGVPIVDIFVEDRADGIYSRAVIRVGEKRAEADCFVPFSELFPRDRVRKMASGHAVTLAAKDFFGYISPWGLLTGVRPAKVAAQYLESGYGVMKTRKLLTGEYFLNPKKAYLATSVAQTELKLTRGKGDDLCSVYISIPFCPTRCAYCSFISASHRMLKILDDYLALLVEDVKSTFALIRDLGKTVASVYIGGGTPTTLDAQGLETLLAAVAESTDVTALEEFTLEAGRPDTITAEKLEIARRYGVTEIFLPEQHPSPDWSDEEDLFDAANVFVVTCSNPDLDAPMTATAVNDNPASRKSTFRRGMRIVTAQSVNNIASQDELQAYADRLRNESLMSTRTITFYTLAEGGHGVGDVIALTHDEIGGVYLETGWRMTLAAGELMTHSAKRTVIA